jgi:hypothetical protein
MSDSGSTPRIGERSLADVLRHAWGDFTPARPNRPPWHQPTLDYSRLEIAITDNRRVISLAAADRVQLQGLESPTDERDDLEPGDWMRGPGWGVAP